MGGNVLEDAEGSGQNCSTTNVVLKEVFKKIL